jgi:transposase InsO family protein
MPKTIVSDRDPQFTGKLFVNLRKLFGIKQSVSSVYQPKTDGVATSDGWGTNLRRMGYQPQTDGVLTRDRWADGKVKLRW